MVIRSSGGQGREEGPPIQEPEQGAPLLSRRRFLSYLSGLLSGVIGAALALPLVRFYVGNAFRPVKARWLKLGPGAEIRPGEPRLFVVSYVVQDGWRETTHREEVYAVTHDRRDYAVLSNVCTHLGCPVHWDEQKRVFLCPCHAGEFSMDGEVTKGPPPKPLIRFAHKVEDGVIYVHVGGA
jgi:menaquinol-cytochrome c reductase iron-sulfur subunit